MGIGVCVPFSRWHKNLDPQLGRFWQIDPRPDYTQSPYASMNNNPILFNDPLGDSILLGNLYDKDKDGNYKNVNEIVAFELFAKTKTGKKYLLQHAQKGFSLKGAFVKGLDIEADEEGRKSKEGVDVGLGVLNSIPNGAAETSDKEINGRLKISINIEKSRFAAPFADHQGWRNGMLDKVDSWKNSKASIRKSKTRSTSGHRLFYIG